MSKIISREALAASVEVIPVPSVPVSSVASSLAPLLRSKSNFDACRIAYEGSVAGHTDAQIAEAVTDAIADLIVGDLPAGLPKATVAKAREDALNTSVAKGGAAVTRPAIGQRRNAWADVVAAGIEPTEATIEAAYRLTTIGYKGLPELRKSLVENVAKESAAKRPNSFVRRATDALDMIRNEKKESRAEKAATESADEKAENVTEEVALDTAADFILYVRATVARTWSDDDKALIAAALTEAASALSGE